MTHIVLPLGSLPDGTADTPEDGVQITAIGGAIGSSRIMSLLDVVRPPDASRIQRHLTTLARHSELEQSLATLVSGRLRRPGALEANGSGCCEGSRVVRAPVTSRPMPPYHVLHGILTVVIVCATASAQADWTRVNVPDPRPSPRASAVAFDSAAGVALLFGGQDNSVTFGDTWEWDGTRWHQRSTATAPAARHLHTLTHMGPLRRTLLFGGSGEAVDQTFADTWIWDGRTWSVVAGPGPSARDKHCAAFDTARGTLVLFGGQGPYWDAPVLDDTWEFDGQRWTLRTPALRPFARHSAAMAYDSHRNRIVLFGGQFHGPSFGDTWEWDGTRWEERSQTGPSPRVAAAMTYDSLRRRVVLFGGIERYVPFAPEYGDTWEWDGRQWTRSRPVRSPAPRLSAVAGCDSANGRVLLLYGLDFNVPPTPFTYFADVWSYSTSSVADYRTFGTGCPGSTGTPRLAAQEPGSRPWIGQTMLVSVAPLAPAQPVAMLTGFSDTAWGTLRLPALLDGVGMPGCMLYTSPDVSIDLSNSSGAATWSAPIPLDIGLAGVQFFNQAIVFDANANSVGVITTNGGAGRIGVL